MSWYEFFLSIYIACELADSTGLLGIELHLLLIDLRAEIFHNSELRLHFYTNNCPVLLLKLFLKFLGDYGNKAAVQMERTFRLFVYLFNFFLSPVF